MAMDREQIERISKALGDATRLRIFEAISSRNGQMVCQDLVAMRGVTPATVSHHMKILSDANLIRCRREGQFVFSEAIPETIDAYSKALAKIATARTNSAAPRNGVPARNKPRAAAAKR
jgi:ArsR family transcriptional regulator